MKLLLAGDIGGTSTRLRLAPVEDWRSHQWERTYASPDFPDLAPVVQKFLTELNVSGEVVAACFAVAGPVVNGVAKLQNLAWQLETDRLIKSLGILNLKLINDFARFPELMWLNKYWVVPPVLFAVTIFLLGGWSALVWGFVVSTVLLWHGTFTINSLSHRWGNRRYETTDTSKNNFVLALVTLGEGWHNNHHHYQASTRNGFFWWEIDITYYILVVFSWIGLVKNLRAVPAHALNPAGKSAQTD